MVISSFIVPISSFFLSFVIFYALLEKTRIFTRFINFFISLIVSFYVLFVIYTYQGDIMKIMAYMFLTFFGVFSVVLVYKSFIPKKKTKK